MYVLPCMHTHYSTSLKQTQGSRTFTYVCTLTRPTHPPSIHPPTNTSHSPTYSTYSIRVHTPHTHLWRNWWSELLVQFNDDPQTDQTVLFILRLEQREHHRQGGLQVQYVKQCILEFLTLNNLQHTLYYYSSVPNDVGAILSIV